METSPNAKGRIGKGGINVIEYFPDGTRLAVASTIGIWIYDVQTCEPLELITGHTGAVNSIVFSPDGNLFASASDDNTACLWDTVHLSTQNQLRGTYRCYQLCRH